VTSYTKASIESGVLLILSLTYRRQAKSHEGKTAAKNMYICVAIHTKETPDNTKRFVQIDKEMVCQTVGSFVETFIPNTATGMPVVKMTGHTTSNSDYVTLDMDTPMEVLVEYIITYLDIYSRVPTTTNANTPDCQNESPSAFGVLRKTQKRYDLLPEKNKKMFQLSPISCRRWVCGVCCYVRTSLNWECTYMCVRKITGKGVFL
jgi:hypothetical protein